MSRIYIGDANGYAFAVRNGYTGTYEDWYNTIVKASLADEYAESAEESATTAGEAANAAEHAAELAIQHGYGIRIEDETLIITEDEEE